MTLALDAEFEIAGPSGVRTATATASSGLETGLEPGEILTAIKIPAFGANDRCVFHASWREDAGTTALRAPGSRGRSQAIRFRR